MLWRQRRHFTYTNIALTVALVFAMSGGAYAVSKYLITSTKQISPKVLKALAGRAGARGAEGAAGPMGPAGAKGETGATGKEGAVGKEGASGVSPSVKEVTTTETTCSKRGGSSFTSGGTTTFACNGKEGKEGSPWTDKGTLPEGASERGQWSVSGFYKQGVLLAGLSFPIPLAAPLGEKEVHFIGLDEGSKEAKEAAAIASGECSGTWEDPGARSGNLCVFYTPYVGAPPAFGVLDAETQQAGAGVSGAVLAENRGSEEVEINYYGSWVVTG